MEAAAPAVEGAAIEYRSVSKRFLLRGSEVQALKDVELQIPQGRLTSVIGPSGCGKTTLLSLCAGFEFPTSGATFCRGLAVQSINTGVGYITQDANLFPWMTLRQNVEFPLEILGVRKPERRERSDAYISMVGLRSFEDHYPYQLSGGMRHRGSIIRTMIYEPDVVLMDEPFASLDMPTRMALQDELLRLLAERPKTVIFVTHDLTEAIALSDTVVVMSKRPATVKHVFQVPFGRPRDVFHIMSQPRFGEAYDELWGALGGEFSENGHRSAASSLPPPLVQRAQPRRRSRPARSAPDSRPSRATRRPILARLAVNAARLAVVVCFLALWQGLAQAGVLNPLLFSNPIQVAHRLLELGAGEQVYGRTIYSHIAVTLQEMAIGYLIGSLIGLAIGFLFGRSRPIARVLEPFVLAVYSVPKIALAPLFVLFLGIGLLSKVGVVGMELFFLVFFNTFTGVRDVNEEFVRLAQVAGASRWQVLRRIVLPSATPSILLGLKMGIPFAMIGAIIGEFIAANQGLGWFILYSASNFDASGLFSAIVLLVVIVWILSQAMQLLENRLLRWRPSRHEEAAVLT